MMMIGFPAARLSSKRERLLGEISNTTIWLEDKPAMRHIPLALEDNCRSCIRHPNLIMNGGAHSIIPPMETDLANCWL